MRKTLFITLSTIGLLAILFFTGPVPQFEAVSPLVPQLNLPLTELDEYIRISESKYSIKPENESRIIWADSIRKTEYAMVYLHGFSAGVMESDPVHKILAEKYGCNLYLARLSEHGLDDIDAFANLTPASLMNSAKEAVAIGRLIGEKVILISCSTGGTLSIYLTATNPELIHAQILYSPNVEIYDPFATLLNGPWGSQIAKKVIGDYKPAKEKWIGTKVEQYWSLSYRTEGLIALQELMDQTMKESVFTKIEGPYFIGYYYKNEEESDHVISVPGILNFDQQTSTAAKNKTVLAFPNVGSHVMASDLQSNDIESVIQETSLFLEEVLHISPVKSQP